MCSMSVLCPLCAVPSFSSIDALQQRLIKAANGPLACPFPNCKELFLGLDKLTIHLFSHTSLMSQPAAELPPTNSPAAASPPPAAAVLKRRGKKSRAKPIELVPPMPSTPPARCDICEFNFRNEELRDIHFRLVHENAEITEPALGHQQEPYKCHLCSKTFRMKGSLRVHLKVLHTVGAITSATSSSPSNNSINNCSNSNLSNNASNSNGHIISATPKISICDRIRHKEASSTNGSSASTANSNTQPYALSGAIYMLKQELPAAAETASGSEYGSTPKNWECDVCTKMFTTKYFLKKHKRLHTGEMPYTCQYCARTFTFQQSYHKHLLYHSEVKPHACGICGRAFKELSTLHNHQRIHSGEKPFKCEVCGKCFRQRVSFLVHTRIHTGVMPYKCELCKKTFRYKVSLRTHKCEPQTPEQLIKALLDSNVSAATVQAEHTASNAAIHMNGTTDQEALLSQTIDDIVVESCQKLGICSVEPPQQPQPVVMDSGVQFDGSGSPLQQLQNLRLYSPQQTEPSSSDGELFRNFLMDAT
ncbi:zinc finger protein 2 [Drosophila navojoa]|uniref:zinc finger protein 2 n=1 Tax=Drosophila navojoa TaxID=7232 RepID=UPI000847518A|nr:zinc finger protein 2 [Drosophila navojoa]